MTMEKNLTTKPKHSKYFYFVCFVGVFVLFSTPIAYIVNKEVREYKPLDSTPKVKLEGSKPAIMTVKEFLEDSNPDSVKMKAFDVSRKIPSTLIDYYVDRIKIFLSG